MDIKRTDSSYVEVNKKVYVKFSFVLQRWEQKLKIVKTRVKFHGGNDGFAMHWSKL